MDLNGSWWILMDLDGSWWILMDLDGSWWILMDLDGSWWILMDLNGSWWILYNLYNSTLPWTPWLFPSRVVFLARLSRCQCSRWWRLRDRSFWSVWPWKWLKFMAVVGKFMANIYGSLWILMDFYVHGYMFICGYLIWIWHDLMFVWNSYECMIVMGNGNV